MQFISDGWINFGAKEFDGNRQYKYSMDFMTNPASEKYSNWSKEVFVPKNIADLDTGIEGVEEDAIREGYWVKNELVDDLMEIDPSGEDKHTLMRWAYLFSPEYKTSESGEIESVGRVVEEDVFDFYTLYNNSLDEVPGSYDSVSSNRVDEPIKVKINFDSTPMIDSEINNNSSLIYSAKPVWGEGDPAGANGLINPYYSKETFNLDTGTDAFGNIPKNQDFKFNQGEGYGDNPFTKGRTSGASEYARYLDDEGKINWFLDSSGFGVKWDEIDWTAHEGNWYNINSAGEEDKDFTKEDWSKMSSNSGYVFVDESFTDILPSFEPEGDKRALYPEHVILGKNGKIEDAFFFPIKSIRWRKHNWTSDSIHFKSLPR